MKKVVLARMIPSSVTEYKRDESISQLADLRTPAVRFGPNPGPAKFQ
jgi:hypothetical protein